MNLTQTHDLLRLVAALDNRRFDDATVAAWHQVLADQDPHLCQQAAIEHFRSSTDYLMPAHIVAGAAEARRALVRQRQAAAVDADRRALPAARRGPVRDRSADVQRLVAELRDALPDGDADTLRHATRYWRQVQTAHRRAVEAVANPRYDPNALMRLANDPNLGGSE